MDSRSCSRQLRVQAYRPQVNLMSIDRSCGVNSRNACQNSLMCGCSFRQPEYSAIAFKKAQQCGKEWCAMGLVGTVSYGISLALLQGLILVATVSSSAVGAS